MKNLIMAVIVSVAYLDIYQRGDKTEIYIEFSDGKKVSRLVPTSEIESKEVEDWAGQLYYLYVDPYIQPEDK
jgi:hypothetical protein